MNLACHPQRFFRNQTGVPTDTLKWYREHRNAIYPDSEYSPGRRGRKPLKNPTPDQLRSRVKSLARYHRRISGLTRATFAAFPHCLRCGAVNNLTIDHIVPTSAGGRDEADNLQTLCMRCNAVKGTRVIDYRPAWRLPA